MDIRRRPPAPSISVSSLTYQVQVPGSEPQHILEKIVWHKEIEVERMRDRVPLTRLRQQLALLPPAKDFMAALTTSEHPVSLIAEVKKASPSKGVIRADFDPVAIAKAYERGGASCLSVLTDRHFFQGSGDYLKAIRAAVDLPLLCKEFVLSPYQIFWARSLGADAVLLIAKILGNTDLQYFLKVVRQLGMVALIEVHDLTELDRVLALDGVSMVGINNRNLADFSVDLYTTQQLLADRGAELSERNITIVGESGIHTPADLALMQSCGVRAVLVGESLVKQPDPEQATRALLGGQ
ncbi:MAG: indole-3-glycerol phosphate synthase TrpC [Cyanobacteria bacterium P01_E01_bin.48]